MLLLRSDEYMTVVLTLGAQGFRREEVRVLRRLSERNDDDFECALLDEARNAPLTADSPWKRYRYLAMDNERNFEANPVPQVLPLVAVMKKADQEKELKRLQTLVSTLELKLLEVDHITYALEKIVGRQKGWTLNKPQVKQIKDLMKVMKQAEKAEKAAAASANPPSHAAKTRKFRSRRKHENR